MPPLLMRKRSPPIRDIRRPTKPAVITVGFPVGGKGAEDVGLINTIVVGVGDPVRLGVGDPLVVITVGVGV